MADGIKRSFAHFNGGEDGASESSSAKKAKPGPPSNASAFTKLMSSAAAQSKSASTSHPTTCDPLNPVVIRVPSPPSLEHWLWLDPFAKRLDAGDVAGVKALQDGGAEKFDGSTVSGGNGSIGGLVIDVDEEVHFVGESAPKPHIEAGPSTHPTSPPADPVPKSASLRSDPSSTNEFKPKIKLALFDLDGTLIRTRSNGVMPKDASDWDFLYGGDGEMGVKGGLRRCWSEGYHLIIISNQNIPSTPPKGKPMQSSQLENWRAKIKQICAKLPPEIPLRILAATQKDEYRKPRIGMFDVVKRLYEEKGLEVDIPKSYYVGDAAGRLGAGGRKGDHNDTDHKFALNAGLRFYTPEQYFWQSSANPNLPHPRGFDARAYLAAMEFVPEVTPTTMPVVPRDVREVVLFVGSPAAGKTTFFRKNFLPKGYAHVNQDTLKSREKCLSVVQGVLEGGKGGCVVDNTNRDRRTRKLYVDLARKAGVPIRCFRFMASAELAMHNNAYRAWCQRGKHDREILPSNAIYSFATAVEEPSLAEGFDEVRRVDFHFEGEEEEDVERWCRWMH